MSTGTTEIKKTDPLQISDHFKKKQAEAETALYADQKDKATLDKDDFLNLLVTQLRYQDPLNPSDNQQMAAQMAQFSSLEQMKNMATSLEEMGDSIKGMIEQQAASAWSMSSSAATELMGKTVRLRQEEVTFARAGQTMALNVTASTGSELVVANAEGVVVRTLSLDGQTRDGKPILDANGDGKVSWDGKSDSGVMAPRGKYSLQVRDAATGEKTGDVWTDAVVGGVQFDSAGPRIVAGGQTYSMSDLLAVASK